MRKFGRSLTEVLADQRIIRQRSLMKLTIHCMQSLSKRFTWNRVGCPPVCELHWRATQMSQTEERSVDGELWKEENKVDRAMNPTKGKVRTKTKRIKSYYSTKWVIIIVWLVIASHIRWHVRWRSGGMFSKRNLAVRHNWRYPSRHHLITMVDKPLDCLESLNFKLWMLPFVFEAFNWQRIENHLVRAPSFDSSEGFESHQFDRCTQHFRVGTLNRPSARLQYEDQYRQPMSISTDWPVGLIGLRR